MVRQSANWAPLWTHLKDTPSLRRSLICRAFSWVRNSAHWGGAVLVTRSYKLLQSVAATLSGSVVAFTVAVEYDSGNARSVFGAFFQSMEESSSQAQQSLIQERWSRTELSEVVSAASVLVTTRWIFLQPHEIALTGHDTFWLISRWVLMIRLPVWDSGFFFEAKEASLKARNLKSLGWMACNSIWTSACFLASWTAWLASINVDTVAELMADWRKLNLEHKSGRVWTDAYWRLPITARNCCLSLSVTAESGCCFLQYQSWWVLSFWHTFLDSFGCFHLEVDSFRCQ